MKKRKRWLGPIALCLALGSIGDRPRAEQGPRYANEASKKIVEQMVAAHGGLGRWQAAGSVTYDHIFFNPNVPSGASPFTVTQEQIEPETGRSRQSWPLVGADVAFDGNEVWSSDWRSPQDPPFMVHYFYYFVHLPWLSQRPGVVLGEPGQGRLPGHEQELITIAMEFESAPTVGKTAKDSYRLYIDPDDYRLRGYEFSWAWKPMMEAMGMADREVFGPMLRVISAYEDVGGLIVPSRFDTVSQDGTPHGYHLIFDYETTAAFDLAALARPPGAKVH